MVDAAIKINCPQCGADRPHKNGRRSRQQLYKWRCVGASLEWASISVDIAFQTP